MEAGISTPPPCWLGSCRWGQRGLPASMGTAPVTSPPAVPQWVRTAPGRSGGIGVRTPKVPVGPLPWLSLESFQPPPAREIWGSEGSGSVPDLHSGADGDGVLRISLQLAMGFHGTRSPGHDPQQRHPLQRLDTFWQLSHGTAWHGEAAPSLLLPETIPVL